MGAACFNVYPQFVMVLAQLGWMPKASKHVKTKSGQRHKGIRRTFPLFGLLLYYAGLVGAASLLIAYVPGFRDALVAPIVQPPSSQVDELLTGGHPVVTGPATPWPGLGGRGLLGLTAMSWALAVVLPVAWVLMRTRRLRYDPSLVHTLIMLPIVVSGVVLVVKNSLALAFALAGIVAGVRFRQKLDEPEEAVYVLLALGIGLAAGVQALDVALVMSMMFTMIVMTFWRFDIGSIYAKGKGAQLAIGDASLLAPSSRAAVKQVIDREAALADGMKCDGLLVVRTPDQDAARRAIETVASRLASEWRIAEPVSDNGLARVETLLRLKDDCDPAELVAELEARWSDEILAAEYIPFSNSGARSEYPIRPGAVASLVRGSLDRVLREREPSGPRAPAPARHRRRADRRVLHDARRPIEGPHRDR